MTLSVSVADPLLVMVIGCTPLDAPTTVAGNVVAFAKDVNIPRDSLWWLHEKHRAVQVGDWKLIADDGQPWELYDLKTDRAEQQNLAERMPEKVNELSRVWQRQTDAFTELVKKTPIDSGKPGKSKVKPGKNAD